MSLSYTADTKIENRDFTESPFVPGEYEHCVFLQCNLSRVDLSNSRFIDCEFIGCDLSLADIKKTALRDVKFRDSKMLGLHVEDCNEFGLSFTIDGCILDHSSFFRVKLKKTLFRNSQLVEIDLTEADLSGAVFDNCDLTGALFKNTNIAKADFRSSYGYSIDPELNRIKKAKFTLPAVIGLLDKYDVEIV